MAWDVRGKIALVTGATSGIGKVTAKELARRGATVVLTTRDRARGEQTAAEIRAAAPKARVELLEGDLSLMREVRRMATELQQRFDRLELLINNAGAIFEDREVTAEGIERTLATNHLSYFLLTQELLPLMKKSAPARIVNVASDAHKRARIDFDDLQRERGYFHFSVYGQSKLANILFTRELARRLEGTNVTANCLHPGVVATGFGMNRPGLLKLAMAIARPFMISPEKGAETTIYLATAPELEGQSGGYYARKKKIAPSKAAQSDETAKRLWDVTETLIATVLDPRIDHRSQDSQRKAVDGGSQ
ncbi:MAG: SDR family oxidoreductase [Myxococcaceae bacterium]|nr:SDR family oxidoreductase [Myxococcaceae bacterium]